MPQIYHSNAKTNISIRKQIQSNSFLTNTELASQFAIAKQTISKWRNRDFVSDVSSIPKNIHYALNEVETTLIISLRKSTWLPLDEIFEILAVENKSISRSSVYRCLLRNNINNSAHSRKRKS